MSFMRLFFGLMFFAGFGLGSGARAIETMEELVASMRGENFIKPRRFGGLVFGGEYLYNIALF